MTERASQKTREFSFFLINMFMSRIIDELKVCLLSRKENVTDLDSISASTAEVKESIENGWAKLETEYRAEIKDPSI